MYHKQVCIFSSSKYTLVGLIYMILLFKVIPHQIPSSQSSGVYGPHSRPTLPKCPCRVHDVLVDCRLLKSNIHSQNDLVHLIDICVCA